MFVVSGSCYLLLSAAVLSSALPTEVHCWNPCLHRPRGPVQEGVRREGTPGRSVVFAVLQPVQSVESNGEGHVLPPMHERETWARLNAQGMFWEN